jgi:RNA polymerase sigma-70 factor, ECF subfamily
LAISEERQAQREKERRLVAAAQAGDHKAQDALVRVYRPTIHAWCCTLLGDLDTAEDATQEIALKMWQCLDSLRDERAFPHWLHTITKHVCYAHSRRKSSHQSLSTAGEYAEQRDTPEPVDPRPTPEEMSLHRAQLEAIEAELSKVQESMRAVVRMTAEGNTDKEIGEALDLTPSNVRQKRFAFREKIQKLLSGNSGSKQD